MTFGAFINLVVERLEHLYPLEECKALAVRLLKELVEGYKGYEHLVEPQSEFCSDGVEHALERLVAGEPLQYILGYEWFCGYKFSVAPGVLIPRPETEELVERVVACGETAGRVLDICTGSGCIAWGVAAKMPRAQVYGCDISKEALEIAAGQEIYYREGERIEVKFFECDILSPDAQNVIEQATQAGTAQDKFDIIVSNPPYVLESEKSQMRSNVLEHEPHLALFVPDNNPLLFYRRIAKLSLSLLAPGGKLFFEINERYGEQTKTLLEQFGYSNCEVIQDLFGKDRMVCAISLIL